LRANKLYLESGRILINRQMKNIKPCARPAAGNRVAARCCGVSVDGPKSAAVAADGAQVVARRLSSLLLYRHGRWSLRFFPVQLVVLLHRRYGVHRTEQYFGGDLDASGLCGWTVAGTSAAAGRRGTVTAARAVHALGGTVVVHVTARRSGWGTIRHPSLGRTFGYLNVHRQQKRKKLMMCILYITRGHRLIFLKGRIRNLEIVRGPSKFHSFLKTNKQ